MAKDLRTRKIPFVVTDHNPAVLATAKREGFLYVECSADDEHALIKAGVERAATLVLTTNRDEINIFLTLAAKDLNPKIKVISRVNSVFNEDNVQRAGADELVSVPRTAGQKIAELVHP